MMRQGAEFEAVLRTGWRVASRNFVLRAGPNGRAQARLGIIAGRKAASRAVDRNRAKRLIRDIFRVALESLGAYDVTVQLRSDLRSENNAAVRAELERALEALMRRAGSPTVSHPDRQ